MIENGNISYEKAVQEGIKEQQRLVSQTEVVQSANAEATRMIDSAHAEADRLRGECDIYVDSKLAAVRGIPQRHAALGRAWTSSTAHRRGHARLRATRLKRKLGDPSVTPSCRPGVRRIRGAWCRNPGRRQSDRNVRR